MKRRIIVAESDRRTARLLKNLLTAAGYEVYIAAGIAEGFNEFLAGVPDLLIINPEYPSKEGITTVKTLREWCTSEIMVISDAAGERPLAELFEAGADDFVKKPFSAGEILARVKASLRRTERLEAAKGMESTPKYVSGGLSIDYNSRTVTVDGAEVKLTKNEFKLLELLCRYSGRVLTYEFIIKAVWGPQAAGGNGILRVNMANLRKKLEKDRSAPRYLFTENGVGYRVAENTFPSNQAV